MARPSPEQLSDRTLHLGLLTDRQLQEVWSSFGNQSVDLDGFLQVMVRRELLTNYQVDRLLKGEETGYFFGHYKVQYLVGAGTFARVFRAIHSESGQTAAVKVLRNRFSDTPAQYKFFLREGELGLSLRHPNIVQVLEVHSIGNKHFFAMEFIEGSSLRDFVKVRGALKPSEATRLMLDACRGLDYAFQRGITHRDLRMSNVLISSRGQAKLVDFGLASADEALNGNMDFDAPTTRSIDYGALERATGVRKDDPRSDLYFAGCIYYNMLTGRPALVETKNRVQRLSKSRFASIPPIQQLHPSLPLYVVKVLNRAMSLDPAARYQSPGDWMADLETVATRLTEEYRDQPEPLPGNKQVNNQPVEAVPQPPQEEAKQHSVMVVESNVKLQDVFRDGLKKAGYRVLVTSDPTRAVDRLLQDIGAVDCIVFNAQELGELAPAAFNRLTDDSATQGLPALLLLGPDQRRWKGQAKTNAHRQVLRMPITMRQLRATISEVIPLCGGFAASD